MNKTREDEEEGSTRSVSGEELNGRGRRRKVQMIGSSKAQEREEWRRGGIDGDG